MTTAMWVLLSVAILTANMPFFSQKILGLLPTSQKNVRVRVLECVLGFAITGVLAYVFEGQTGSVHHQDWEFWVVVATVYVVLGFPGMVWRYLWLAKHKV